MMKDTSLETKEQLTKEELLEIECICDSFEEHLRSNTSLQARRTVVLEPFLQKANPRIRTRLSVELLCIKNAPEWNSLAEDSTDSVVTTSSLTTDTTNTRDKKSWMQGRVPERFQLVELLGSGASSEVWLAVDLQLHRQVAIKIAHTAGISPLGFLREARSNSRLTHPNIVRVLEIASEDVWPYLVCELIDGESLEKRLAFETPSHKVCAKWLSGLSDALAYSHSEGVVHRDIKPQNILIDKRDHVFLADFGIAKDYTDFEATQTRTGHCIGTPAYMSPQQASGQTAASPTDDIYSLGVVMYKMLTGEVPFRGSAQSVLFQLVHSDPIPIRETHPEVPVELELLCMKCLEKRPSDRLPSAAFLRDELNRFLRDEALVSRPATRMQQVLKWMRRNPRLTQSLSVTVSALVLLTLFSLLFAWNLRSSWRQERAMRESAQKSEIEANEALKREKIAFEQAQYESKVSIQVVGFLESLFQSNDPVYSLLQDSSSRSLPTLHSVLESASTRIETELDGQPHAQARLLDILGNAYRSIGYPDQAKTCLRRSEEIQTEYGETLDSENAFRSFSSLDKGIHEYYLGCLVHDQGDLGGALAHYQTSLSILSEANPDAERTQLALSDVEFQIGRLFFDRRDNAQAFDWMSRSLQHRRGILARDSVRVKSAEIAVMLSEVKDVTNWPEHLMSMLGRESSWANDIAAKFATLTLARTSLPPNKVRPQFEQLVESLESSLTARHPITLLASGDYAGWLHDQGEYALAYPLMVKLIQNANTVAPNHPQLRQAKVRFAFELTRSMRLEEANRIYKEILSGPSNDLGVILEAQLGNFWCSSALGQTNDVPPINKLIELYNSRSGHEAAWCAHAVSRGFHSLGDYDSAKKYASLARDHATTCHPIPENPLWLERLATIHAVHNELERATDLLQIAVAKERAMRPPKHPRLADKLLALGGCLQKNGKPEEAAPLLQEALDIYLLRMPATDSRIESARKQLEPYGIKSVADQ